MITIDSILDEVERKHPDQIRYVEENEDVDVCLEYKNYNWSLHIKQTPPMMKGIIELLEVQTTECNTNKIVKLLECMAQLGHLIFVRRKPGTAKRHVDLSGTQRILAEAKHDAMQRRTRIAATWALIDIALDARDFAEAGRLGGLLRTLTTD